MVIDAGYFLSLPVHKRTIPGIGFELNLTLGVVMAVLLVIAVFITLTGGRRAGCFDL